MKNTPVFIILNRQHTQNREKAHARHVLQRHTQRSTQSSVFYCPLPSITITRQLPGESQCLHMHLAWALSESLAPGFLAALM